MNAHPFSHLFDEPDAWQVVASGRAEGNVTAIKDEQGRAGLRLDYDFHGGGGFVVIRRVLHFKIPETFEIAFHLRGDGPTNHFEFKLTDPSGANVWRHRRPYYELPKEWVHLHFNERDLPFAWGPAGGGAPSAIGAVELVIAAGPGGKGFLELALPTIKDETLHSPHAIYASSSQTGFSPEAVFLTVSKTSWRAAADDTQPWWSVDFGHPFRFGGLVIEWPPFLPPRSYHVELSDDGETWKPIYQAATDRAATAFGEISHIPMPGAEARQLRITFGNAECAALLSIKLKPDAFSHTPNEFIHHIAADFPRGWFPRYWLREQSYWTPVGSPQGKRRALINEEGMVEVDEAGFSLEAFILSANQCITWADVDTIGALPADGAPLPSVSWHTDGMHLQILPWVDGQDDQLTLHVTYRLECSNPSPNTRLIVTVRPYQVNPPWQAFRNLGGRSPIHQITCNDSGMNVEGRDIIATPRADESGSGAFEEGGVMRILSNAEMPQRKQVNDESGLASAAMAWNLPDGQSTIEATLSVPYFHSPQFSSGTNRNQAFDHWENTLETVQWNVPKCAAPAIACFRTAAGHILINRDGPAIQPGPRRYTRSWVRDCVIMGAALAKAGLKDALRDFLTWYAQFERDDGFIPAVVDRDGVDWLVEHDSHGQFLWGIREVFRNDNDLEFVRKIYPHVQKAADYLITLRAQRMTAEYQSAELVSCYGLLPESASHEGYLAHPVHSYWDDFWGIRGLESAADIAQALDLTDSSERWKAEASRFQNDVLRSIDQVIANKNLTYIPGSVEWADFDPTATSNAIAQLDFADVLPEGPLHAMLQTYLDGFRRKHRGEIPWVNYTAYEIRIIGAFVRLGKRDEANELLDFFLSDRRPLVWNQWPEITWRDPRSPGHLGDVPHTWIAAEYLLALASMVANERESTDSMVLASGMPWSWISQEDGFSVTGLPTRHGALNFKIKASLSDSLEIEVGGSLKLPPGGLTIIPPLPIGMCIEGQGTTIQVESLPYRVDLQLSSIREVDS